MERIRQRPRDQRPRKIGQNIICFGVWDQGSEQLESIVPSRHAVTLWNINITLTLKSFIFNFLCDPWPFREMCAFSTLPPQPFFCFTTKLYHCERLVHHRTLVMSYVLSCPREQYTPKTPSTWRQLIEGVFPLPICQSTDGVSPLPWRQSTEGISPYHNVSPQRGYQPFMT